MLQALICDKLAQSYYGVLCVKFQTGRTAALISAVIMIFGVEPALAATGTGEPDTVACPNPAVAPVPQSIPSRVGVPITLSARRFDASNQNHAQATGDVELRRSDQQMDTDLIRYLPTSKSVQIPGPMIYQDAQIQMQAETAEYSFVNEQGVFTGVEYSLVGSTANGTAGELRLDAGNRSFLREMEFTTCPGNSPQWLLTARELELRHEKGYGIARGAKLEFMNVPFLYLPWISFPIDDRRKSGFLYPHFSSANDNGFEVGMPYYWNIAPNQDATITPRFFTDRGFMLTSEYRMLSARSAGSLAFDYLYDDKKTRQNRYHYELNHFAAINRQWRSYMVIDRVSDNQYFQDFGLSLAATARQFLHSRAGIDGGGRYWTLSLLADDFQVIDEAVAPAQEPYRRVPRIAYNLDRPIGGSGFQFALDSEIVGFDREIGVTGVRSDFHPQLKWGVERHWGFFRANLGYRYTAYNLDLDGATGDESPDRGTEIASLDSGMYFERNTANGRIQTLEPRVFYLYVPYVDQDDLPDFDTGEFTFGFAQLFHTNRFTGADRQADADRLTLALSTRSLDVNTGRERWSLSAGQIFYFGDRRVTIGDEAPVGTDTSPIVAEFIWHPFTRFTGRLGAQYSWENSELDVGTFGLDFTSRSRGRIGFEYRYRRDRLDQFDIRHYWVINERWSVLSRVNYSLADSDLLEAQFGIEYENCCWAARIISRRYLRSRFGDERDALYFELNLKGLGSFGRQPPPLFYDEAE